MKITYEFDTADENFNMHELEEIKQASRMSMALSDILETMRKWLKYEGACPMVDEYSEYWDRLSEDKKQFYKEHKIPDIDRMVDEIRDIISSNVDMEKMGY